MTSDLGEAKSVDRSNNFCRPAHQLWASEPLSDATQRLSLASTILLKMRASYTSFTYRYPRLYLAKKFVNLLLLAKPSPEKLTSGRRAPKI